LSGRGGTVTTGSLRPPRPSPVGPACPVFMGPCTLAGAPRRLPRRRSTPPLGDSPSEARVTAAPEGGPGGAIPSASPLARLVWPTSATQAPPDTPPCPPHGDGACPLGPGGPPTIRGGHRRHRTGKHPGPTLGGCQLADLESPNSSGGPALWPWAAGTATPLEGGTVTAGHLAPILGESAQSQSRGDTWIRVMGGRIQSVRNGHWLSRGKYVLLTYTWKHSGGDPLVIAP